MANERQVYNEYYEEDDEDFEESLTGQPLNPSDSQPSAAGTTTVLNQPVNPSNLASINSSVVNNLNRIDINELFDAYGEEEGAAAAGLSINASCSEQ